MSALPRGLLGAAFRAAQTPPATGNTPGTQAEGNVFGRLSDLYARMEAGYAQTAAAAGLTCTHCETNCCVSYFRHHTYVEWAYLWRGLQSLAPARRKIFAARAEAYVRETQHCLAMNIPPTAMCPVNEDGLCALYPYRLMICRMHGTRNAFTLPDGRRQVFPGCARFTALPCATEADCPTLDRTPYYKELAELELALLRRAKGPLPRVNLTLAEMIVNGPPRL